MNSYQAALSNLDADGPQYITSNTIDEISHAHFLNGYLESKGEDPVNFDEFRTLQGSTATGADNIGRLTCLSTSMSTPAGSSAIAAKQTRTLAPRFRKPLPSTTAPPSPSLMRISTVPAHIQVIANIAAFHFGYIEQGGASLYAAMGQKASSPKLLEIIFGIGGDEVAHFLEWVDFAGNGVQPPVAPVTDNGLTFPNFFASPLGALVQPSLIFPVPCEFISPSLPHCSVIRPLTDKFGGAVATIASFTADGLFFGQSKEFLNVVNQIATEADAAVRQRLISIQLFQMRLRYKTSVRRAPTHKPVRNHKLACTRADSLWFRLLYNHFASHIRMNRTKV